MGSVMAAIERLKAISKNLKSEIAALYLACKSPDVPWYAKAFTVIVVGYALSPIDLIPDFIPVLGYLDDLILIPLGISIAIRLVPKDVMEECRSQAKDLFKEGRPQNRIAAFVIILIWVVIIGLLAYKVVV